MSINRRTAIRQPACILAGAALLPSCLQDRSGKIVPYRNFNVEGWEEKLMEELAATLIPTTDTPGAKDVSAHLLVWRMMDDCASSGDWQKFMNRLKLFVVGFAVDWPLRYADLAPWYSYVEKFVGISGNKDGLPHLPDGEFLPPLELTCVERYFRDFVRDKYSDRQVIYGRCAHLTEPTQLHLQQGRGRCQKRNLCRRGDEKKGRASGVRVIDANIRVSDSGQAPGLDIHEMGGVRIGRDPRTSLLNKWNQLHACQNVFVTDGALMTSTSTQNPSLTYMATTARAVDHAVSQFGHS